MVMDGLLRLLGSMCNSPILIKNPNRGRFLAPSMALHSDTQSQYISVPCGKCNACRFVKQSSYFQRMLVESQHSYVYFCTLTYNNESLVTVDVGDESFSVAPYDDIQKMLKRIRKKNPFDGRSWKHLFVRENGKKGRAHWHGLFFIDKADDTRNSLKEYVYEKELKSLLLSQWKRNIGKSDKFPEYRDNFTYAELYKGGKLFRNFDCHLVTSNVFGDEQNPLFYLLKYISKGSKLYYKMYITGVEYFGKDTPEFKAYFELIRPKIWKSVNFGVPDDPDYIPSMIRRSVDNNELFPKFYDKVTSYPLSNYYRKKYMTFDQDAFFKARNVQEYGCNLVMSADPIELRKDEKKRDRKLDFSSRFDLFDLLDE